MSSTTPATVTNPKLTETIPFAELCDSHNGWVDTLEARERIRRTFGHIETATLVNVMTRTVEQIESGRVTKLAIVKLEFGIAEMEARAR